jgi:hypothetical protein
VIKDVSHLASAAVLISLKAGGVNEPDWVLP